MDLERVVGASSIEVFSQVTAAERQIDRAIDLCINEQDYLCAITLAGAADSILGEALKSSGKTPMVDYLKSVLKEKYFPELSHKEITDLHLNKIRNILKHSSNDLDANIEHAVDLEAITVIIRAIGNYAFVTEQPTQRTVEFFQWLRKCRPELYEEADKFEAQGTIE